MPSRAAASAGAAVLVWVGLAMFDPTELSIVLEDMTGIAFKTMFMAAVVGWGVSIPALILYFTPKPTKHQKTLRGIGWTSAGILSLLMATLFLLFGYTGNYGDRLFVILKDQADISDVENIKDRDDRLTTAYQQLTKHAEKTQADLRETLDRFGIEYTPYYLENAIEVRGGFLVRLYLSSREDVDRIIPSPRLRPVPTDVAPAPAIPGVDGSVQWNISMIGADKVWAEFNVRGEGIVVGSMDTGVDINHPAVRQQYRGLRIGDDYNWYDPWNHSLSPHDELTHGTHTVGTVMGSNGIGVAPDAKWIACVNLDRNLANPALYLECMQFMFAPFPHDGDPFKDGDPTKAPHITNNSWGCPEIEGCDANALKQAAENFRHAGIFMAVSAGNDGPLCETVAAPLAIYDSVFSVGAVNILGDVSVFSSRGPVTFDGSGRIKPDIVAPGEGIISSVPNGGYASYDGTSMAGPHVAGAVALLWSAKPELIGDIDSTEQLLRDTAARYRGDDNVGCFSKGVPNTAYGYGILDIYAAVKQVLKETP
jgi:subtilisin family serine protease